MKTWEIMQEIQNKGEEMVGKKYKIVKSNYNGISNIRKGEIAVIRRFMDFLALTTESGGRIIALTGFEEWEEVREPVTWQEAFQAWIDGKNFRIEYEGKIYSQSTNFKLGIQSIKVFTGMGWEDGIDKAILKKGKFYIED